MNKNIKCALCDAPNAKIIKIHDGSLMIACTRCLDLGIKAFIEREIFGSELNVFIPKTFRDKPANSLIWLLSFAKVHEMTKH